MASQCVKGPSRSPIVTIAQADTQAGRPQGRAFHYDRFICVSGPFGNSRNPISSSDHSLPAPHFGGGIPRDVLGMRRQFLLLGTLALCAMPAGCQSGGACIGPCAGDGLRGCGWCTWNRFVSDCGVQKCQPKPYATFGKYWQTGDLHATEKAARKCAAHALHELKKQCGQKAPADYASGFEQAFVDISHGGTGVTPPVPPSLYWNAHYRTPEGRQAAEMWFVGYEDGVASAQRYGIFQNRQIAVSSEAAWTIAPEFHPTAVPPIAPGAHSMY